MPEEDWPSDEAQRGVILGDFAPGCGDRRQEIVFIGVKMDEVRAGVGVWGEEWGCSFFMGSECAQQLCYVLLAQSCVCS